MQDYKTIVIEQVNAVCYQAGIAIGTQDPIELTFLRGEVEALYNTIAADESDLFLQATIGALAAKLEECIAFVVEGDPETEED